MRVLETKIPAPVVIVAVAGGMNLLSPTSALPLPGSPRDLVASAIAIASGVIAAAAFFAFWRGKTTFNPFRPERASALLTRGVFGLTRNPLYLSLALLLLAYAVRLGGVVAYGGPLLFLVYITRFQVVPEERAMHAKFGSAWARYTRTVRRWI